MIRRVPCGHTRQVARARAQTRVRRLPSSSEASSCWRPPPPLPAGAAWGCGRDAAYGAARDTPQSAAGAPAAAARAPTASPIAAAGARLCHQQEQAEPLERQPLEGVWSRLAPVPTPRSEVAAAALNGKVYVLGGFGAGATANEEYDPLANTWRQRAPVPQGVDHAAAAAIGGKIYLIEGFDGSFRPVNKTWSSNPETNSWTRKTDLPTPRGALGATARHGLGAVASHNQIYVLAGDPTPGGSQSALNEVVLRGRGNPP